MNPIVLFEDAYVTSFFLIIINFQEGGGSPQFSIFLFPFLSLWINVL